MIYIDVDGTMTEDGAHAWGSVRQDVVDRVRELIESGKLVAIWSARGEKYAREFAEKNGLGRARFFLSKPSMLVDDNPRIRDPERMVMLSPDEFMDMTDEAGGGNPLVSVILPTYQYGHRIEGMLESLEAQEFSRNRFEVIVVDDGSTDDTASVLVPWVEKGVVDTAISFGKNRGAAEAINAGSRMASGKYWAWVSADNVMTSDWLATLVRLMEPDVGAVYSNYDRFDDHGRTTRGPSWGNPPGTWGMPYDPGRLLRDQQCFFGPSFMIRADVWKAAGEHRGRGSHDYDHWLRVEEACASESLRIVYSEKVLCHYYCGNERSTVVRKSQYDADKWQAEARRRRERDGSPEKRETAVAG